jgi:hypothetical protein
MVTLSDYQFNAGAGLDNQVLFGGSTSQEDLNNLNKALYAGQTTGRDNNNLTNASGSPLKVESLDKTLKNLTYGDKQIVFWKSIPKSPAYNTVEEFNQLSSYGSNRGGFYNEGALPSTEDSTYVRRSQLIKFLGVVKEVTHPMTLVNTMVGDVIKREIENGTMWILRKLDTALFTADSDLIPQEFNGLYKQHAQNDQYSTLTDYLSSDVVIDMRGSALTESAIEDAANGILQHYGIGTDLYAPPKVISDFVKNFYGNKFIMPNSPALTAGVMGQNVQKFASQFGEINLNYDIFQNPSPARRSTDAQTSLLAPAAPTADGSTPSAAVGATVVNSKFASSDAGNYVYAVSAVNCYGESALTVLGTAVTVVASGAVDLKFTMTNSSNPAVGFVVYRTLKGGTPGSNTLYYPIFTVTTTQLAAGFDGASAGLARDNNRYLPNTYQAMLVQNDSQVIEFKQLAPLMKMDLAITSPSFKFMMLLYGTPFLYAPGKMVRFINIGNA